MIPADIEKAKLQQLYVILRYEKDCPIEYKMVAEWEIEQRLIRAGMPLFSIMRK